MITLLLHEQIFLQSNYKIKFINFQIVPTIELSKLTNLTYLSLSGNCFTSIPPVALLNLFHLRELYLDRLDSLIKIDSRYVYHKYTKMIIL